MSFSLKAVQRHGLVYGLITMMVLVAGLLLYRQVGSADCHEFNSAMETMHQQSAFLINGLGETISVNTYVADEDQERAIGYQYVCSKTVDKTSILFAYDRPVVAQFHMHNVKVPLDIGFFDRQGLLIQWMTMDIYQGDEHPLYGPKQPFQYALEARQGFFKENKLMVGNSKLELHASRLVSF